MKTYTIDLPGRYHINAETPREARDQLVKKLQGSDPTSFCNAKFTDHEGLVTLLDAVDCCDDPDIMMDGECITCGHGEK
jgi:hypothetical protein